MNYKEKTKGKFMQKFVLLPFDKIEKGSSIIIYGAGDVGKCLLQQIKATNYCKVVCFVDQKAESIQSVEGIRCILPSQISAYQYDYFLFGKLSPNFLRDMNQHISNMRINKEKVILLEDRYIMNGYDDKTRRPDEVNWIEYYNEAEEHAYEQYNEYLKPLIDKYNLLDDGHNRIIDFACGHGRMAEIIRDKCKSLICCDINEEALSFCKNRFHMYQNLEYINSSIEGIKVEDETCNLIYSWDAMVHFSNDLLKIYLKDFYRIVKPDGYVLIHHSNLDNVYVNRMKANWLENPSARSNTSKEKIKEMAEEIGFIVVEQKVIDWANINGLDCISVLRK